MNYENIFKKEEKRLEKLKQYDLIELDLLTIEQVESLEIFVRYGTKAATTDFSAALGGIVSNYLAFEGINLSDRTGSWWTKSCDESNNIRTVGAAGFNEWNYINRRCSGCRPNLPFSSISKISSNKVKSINGILEVEFGEYPQWVCSKKLCEELEDLYSNNNLNKTGKVYTIDSRHYYEYLKDFEPQEHIEYEYNGKKYVRVKVNSYYDGRKFTFSNGEKYKDGDFVWISVSPIKWLVDEKSNIAITKNIIISGIQFNKRSNYTGDNFDEMNIKRFMDKYLLKEIMPDIINYKTNNEIKTEIRENTLESIIEEAKREMKEILGTDYSYILDEKTDSNYQKQLKK